MHYIVVVAVVVVKWAFRMINKRLQWCPKSVFRTSESN